MKNKTKMDLKIHRELIRVSSGRIKLMGWSSGILLIIYGFYIHGLKSPYGIMSLVGGVAILIIFVLCAEKLLLRENKSNLLSDKTYNIYEFSDENFVVTGIREEEEISRSKLKYSDIIKVVENADYLFMYISNAQVLPLSKKDMIEGEADDLTDLIKSKVNKYKYIK